MRKVGLLSVAVPCHNEQEVLPSTHKRLRSVLDKLAADKKCADYELIYVDDGSKDNTLGVLKDIFENDKFVRVIVLRNNFGHQGAITAGMACARGDAVVTLDADLQDPPEKIGDMISHYEEDYDLVLGVRKDRSSDSLMKKFFAENYYRFLKFLGVDIVHNHGDFRLMARALVDEFNALPERNRFIRAMILSLESRYATVYYNRESRKHGKTKFTPGVMLSFSMDGIVSFSYMPLRLVALSGIFMCIIALIGVAWVIHGKFFRYTAPGWTSTLAPILAIGGFQLFALGLIGEYVGRLYIEVKQRPLFLVRKEYTHKMETR